MPTAIILSLGMLNQTVDTNKFIGPLLTKAKTQNTNFELTQTIQTQAFKFSNQLNKNEITPGIFKENLLELFNLKMEEDEFWNLWNSMVTVGDVKSILDDLKTFATKNALLLYFHTDTNIVHLQKLMKNAYQANGVNLDLNSQPPKLIVCMHHWKIK